MDLIFRHFSATIERPGLGSLPDGNKEAKVGQHRCRGLQEGHNEAKVVAEGYTNTYVFAEGYREAIADGDADY